MPTANPKAHLHEYLDLGREALLWKLDGLSEYDVRRPMTPTGTNLIGLVKHLSGVEIGYFGIVFDRPFPGALPWDGDEEPNVDMWASPDESRDDILDLYERARQHADTTIRTLDADSAGRVPGWPADGRDVTLLRILVHVATETHRHAGHADILRELVDGAAGRRAGSDNLPDADETWWHTYYERLERAARAFR